MTLASLSRLRAARGGAALGAGAFVAALALVATLYVLRVASWPAYDFDELGFLNLAYRFVSFLDLRYPVMLDSGGFGAEPLRKYPPIMASQLRSLIHGVIGFSAFGSRIVSGAFMLGSIVLVALIGRRMGASWPMLALLVLVVGLQPSVIVAARTVRLEQEIIFLGVLALALPLLIGKRFAKAAWLVSGLCASAAGLSHPWGLALGAGLGLAALLMPRTWRAHDGLASWQRLLLLGCGALPPALATAYQVFHDWPLFRDYVAAQTGLYAIRNQQNIAWHAGAYPGSPAFALLPAYWAAKVHEFAIYAALRPLTYPYPLAFAAVLLAQAALVLVFLAAGLRRIEGPRDLPGVVLAFATLGVLCMFLTYPPSSNYFAYVVLIIPSAAALVGILAWTRPAPGPLRRGLRFASAVIAGAALLSNGQFAMLVARGAPRDHQAVRLDPYLQAQDEMGRALGFKDTAHAYCDMATWIACGRQARSGLQAVVLATAPLPERVDAAAFHQPLLGGLVDSFPSFTTPTLTGPQKVERLERLTSGLALAGLVRLPYALDLYYVRRDPAAAALRITEVDLNGATMRWLGEAVTGDGCAFPALTPGRYVILTRADAEAPPAVRLAGQPLATPFNGGRHLPRALFFDVRSGEAVDACSGDSRGLRLLRLSPAPA